VATELPTGDFTTSSEENAVKFPDTEVRAAAMNLGREHSPPFLFNHVMRSYAFGRGAGASRGVQYDEEVFFLAAVLHALGLVERFIGVDRFEIDGAGPP
jgi:hypothetical protein